MRQPGAGVQRTQQDAKSPYSTNVLAPQRFPMRYLLLCALLVPVAASAQSGQRRGGTMPGGACMVPRRPDRPSR